LDVQRIAHHPPLGEFCIWQWSSPVSVARLMTRLEQFVTPACNSLKTRNI
jgi:hypothetical protein